MYGVSEDLVDTMISFSSTNTRPCRSNRCGSIYETIITTRNGDELPRVLDRVEDVISLIPFNRIIKQKS